MKAMDFAQGLSSLLGLGVASGLNVYAAVLTIGLAQRWGWISGLPQGLEILSHPWVLGIAALMYVAEFIADKVPGFTPIWDSVHTVIRPLGGALLAMGAAGNLDPKLQVVAMLIGGTVALGTHATKMGTRLAAHAVPDPVTHSVISMAEDVGVVGILMLAYTHPLIALPLLLAIVTGIAIMVPFLLRVLRFLLRTVTGRLLSFNHPNPDIEIPAWARRSGERSVLAFVRNGKGLGRLRQIYLGLGGTETTLRLRSLFGGQKTIAVSKCEEPVRGLFLDSIDMTAQDGAKISVYLTKDWAGYYRDGAPAPQARAIGA